MHIVKIVDFLYSTIKRWAQEDDELLGATEELLGLNVEAPAPVPQATTTTEKSTPAQQSGPVMYKMPVKELYNKDKEGEVVDLVDESGTPITDPKEIQKLKQRYLDTGSFIGSFAPNQYVNATHPGGHDGVDIRGRRGAPVYAIGPGIVTKINTGTPKGGNSVNVDHEGGKVQSYYAHLDTIKCKVGDQVDNNTEIGTIGNTGNAKQTAPHLHYSIKVNGKYVDPLSMINTTVS